MQAPAEIAGLIELRGRGIVQRPHIKQGTAHLLVDLVETYERFVEEDELRTEVSGVEIARCPVPVRRLIDSAHQRLLVNEALNDLGG